MMALDQHWQTLAHVADLLTQWSQRMADDPQPIRWRLVCGSSRFRAVFDFSDCLPTSLGCVLHVLQSRLRASENGRVGDTVWGREDKGHPGLTDDEVVQLIAAVGEAAAHARAELRYFEGRAHLRSSVRAA